MASAPAIQLYVGDFLNGTRFLSNAQTGLYIRLLLEQADKGYVSQEVIDNLHVYGKDAQAIWPTISSKFTEKQPGKYVNERMEKVLAEREAFRLKQSEKGKLSAEARLNRGKTKRKPRINRGSTVVEPLEGEEEGIVSSEEGKERAKGELQWPSFAGPKVKAKWQEFIRYRITEKNERYKTLSSEQRALNLAVKYFPSGRMFVEGLDHAMARTWTFPVNPSEYKYPFSEDAVPEKKSTIKPWIA